MLLISFTQAISKNWKALTEIADQQQGMITSVLETAQGVAAGVGAPAVLTGLLGAAGGFLVPTPGQRRRQQLAKQEGEIEAKKNPPQE